MTKRIDIAEFIDGVREQLSVASANASSKDLAFEVGAVDIEFTVHTERSGTASAGLKFWLLTADAEAKHMGSTTQKIVLSLRPHNRENGLPINVSGRAEPGER